MLFFSRMPLSDTEGCSWEKGAITWGYAILMLLELINSTYHCDESQVMF